MKALIFGANGQVGRALVAAAADHVDVDALDRHQCDIAEKDEVEAAIRERRPDLVINAAAYTAVDRSESEPELARQINALAPGWMALAAKRTGSRFVHLSTDFVFDGSLSRPYKPHDEVAPLGVYGRTKQQGENAVREANHDALIIRTAWVYAAQGSNFMKTMLGLMPERDEIFVVSDQVGTPTYAPSLALGLWQLADKNASGTFHFTDSGVASWYDFAVAIEEEGRASGLLDREVVVQPISTEKYPTPARRPPFAVLDKAATWDVLGYSAPHWRVNLRAALKELKNNG